MRPTTSRTAAAAGLAALLSATACQPEMDTDSTPPVVMREFTGHFDSASGTLAFTFDQEEVGTSRQGLEELPVVQDGKPGTGPANTVELVTTSTAFDGACKAGDINRFCGDVTVRSFYGVPLRNVWVEVTSISPAGFVAVDDVNAPVGSGLNSQFGLWSYGRLAPGGGNASQRWHFRTGSGNFTFRGRVMADVGEVAGIANHVVISEFCGGTGTSTTNEFVELYNPTDFPVNLNGWTVQYKSSTGTSYSGSVTINATTAPGGTIIPPHGYFLLAGAGYPTTANAANPTPDVRYSFDSSSSTSGGGHIRIGPGLSTAVNDTKTVDKLGYGDGNSPEGSRGPAHPASGGSIERKAVETSTSSTMGSGADALRGNGRDSDNNRNDFVTRTTRQPQNSKSTPEFP